MKARVKATGEIVEINESSTIYDARMCHIYNASELENIPDTDPDYERNNVELKLIEK